MIRRRTDRHAQVGDSGRNVEVCREEEVCRARRHGARHGAYDPQHVVGHDDVRQIRVAEVDDLVAVYRRRSGQHVVHRAICSAAGRLDELNSRMYDGTSAL